MPQFLGPHALPDRLRTLEELCAVEPENSGIEEEMRKAVRRVGADDAVGVTDGDHHADPANQRAPRRDCKQSPKIAMHSAIEIIRRTPAGTRRPCAAENRRSAVLRAARTERIAKRRPRRDGQAGARDRRHPPSRDREHRRHPRRARSNRRLRTATTARPAAIASAMTIPNGSGLVLACTTMSRARIAAGTSAM